MKNSIITDILKKHNSELVIKNIAFELASHTANPIKFIIDCNLTPPEGMALLLDGSRGTYIPSNFIKCYNWHGIEDDDKRELSNPDNEFYWDTWNDVLDRAYVIQNGFKYTLLQNDGDLWAICYDLMTKEEKTNFGFED